MFASVDRAAEALGQASCELEPDLLDGRDAARLLEMVARWERMCAAMKARLARRVDETKVWRDGGHRSAAHFLATTTGATVGAAARTLETARALDELPATDEAFRAGELSETQAAEITSAAGDDPAAETELLATAAEHSVKGLQDRCRQVRAGAQADDQAWARRLHTSRRAHRWPDRDGAWRADIRLGPDAGARVDSAWDAHLDRIFEEARRAGRREPREAYAADAFVAAMTEGPCKPIEVRLDVSAAAFPRGHTEPGERCEIAGVPVPVTTAKALLADARSASWPGRATTSPRSPNPPAPSPPACAANSRPAIPPAGSRTAPTTGSSRSTTSSPSPKAAAVSGPTPGGSARITTT